MKCVCGNYQSRRVCTASGESMTVCRNCGRRPAGPGVIYLNNGSALTPSWRDKNGDLFWETPCGTVMFIEKVHVRFADVMVKSQ